MSELPALQNPTHILIEKYAIKLLQIKKLMATIKQQRAAVNPSMNFESPIWTETEIDVFEQEKKIQLPDEYKACLMEVGEISRDYFSGLLNISLRNRLAKDFTRMKKKAIPATKVHNIGSLYGKGWVNESCFKVLKEEDKFRLYRKLPLFSPDASYEELFRLKSWNAYLNGCLAMGDDKYLILNGDFKGEVWKYGSEPEGEYAPTKYRECFTPVNAARPHLLDNIIEYLARNV